MVDARISPQTPFCFFLFCLRRNALPSDDELKTWRLATIILVLLAAVMFFFQHFIAQFFDIAFEIFIFYVPAFLIVLLFLYFRRRPRV